PDMHPSDLFDLRYNRGCIPGHNTYPGFRFVGKLDPNQMLLFVAGDTNPEGDRTGSAVVFNSIFREPPTKFSSPDITKADHDVLVQRAVLRAATKALGMVRWGGEGFHSVVIATDNEYIVKSIYERMPVWQTDGFKDENGVNIENKHFWKRLLRGMRKQEELGVQVQYWLIPKEWNEAVL
ncbi:hypothetical protein BZA05DRAFT_313483, partial [Tricharina praecox]|uniref:uncharacterized protein n=1 Tax=Tricharina praecox TaxID=43433 RepID=UPI00221F75A4